MQCLKRCLKPNDPIFDDSESRKGEVAACVSNCAFNYVKYRIEVKEMFKVTMDNVEAHNDRVWSTFLDGE